MSTWIIVVLLLPFALNQLDQAAGKMMTLHDALRRRKRNKKGRR